MTSEEYRQQVTNAKTGARSAFDRYGRTMAESASSRLREAENDRMQKAQAAQQAAAQQAASLDLTNPTYANSSQPYMAIYEQLRRSLQNQRATDVKNMETNRDADLSKSNAGYDSTARQNYINYMQAQKRLPSELNALGIRGGASESSLIRLGTNYGTNVASNESARQSALADIRRAYAQQIADYDRNLNDRLAEAEATARQNQLNWEREQQEKDLEYFSGSINGLYKTKEGYQNLINQLAASNDPNKEYKIALARNAMNALAGGSSSGGSSGGSSKKGSGGGGSSKNSNKKNSGGGGGNTATYTITKNTGQKNQSTSQWLGNGAKGRAVK